MHIVKINGVLQKGLPYFHPQCMLDTSGKEERTTREIKQDYTIKSYFNSFCLLQQAESILAVQ